MNYIIKPQKVLHLADEKKKKNPKIYGKYLGTIKKDGWYVYCDYILGKGWGSIHSRACRKIPSMEQATKFFDQLPKPRENVRFILEAYIPDTPFHIMNGIFNRSVGNYICEDVHFYLHDIINLDSYYKTGEAKERFKLVQEITRNKIDRISQIPFLGLSGEEREWKNWFYQALDSGEEGIILKQENSLYFPDKRNSSLMKWKAEISKDLLCIGHEWTVGDKGNDSLNLKFKRKNGVEITCRVGKHNDIALFEKDKNNFIGKLCTIRAMEELDSGMLREPRFVCVRNDKTIEERE